MSLFAADLEQTLLDQHLYYHHQHHPHSRGVSSTQDLNLMTLLAFNTGGDQRGRGSLASDLHLI